MPVGLLNPHDKAPYVENSLTHGLSYCQHKHQLMEKNHNVFTYEGNHKAVCSWRIRNVSLGSIMATKKPIHVYSTKGRNVAKLISMIDDIVASNGFDIEPDTLFFQTETQSFIISLRATNTSSSWNVLDHRKLSRRAKSVLNRLSI